MVSARKPVFPQIGHGFSVARHTAATCSRIAEARKSRDDPRCRLPGPHYRGIRFRHRAASALRENPVKRFANSDGRPEDPARAYPDGLSKHIRAILTLSEDRDVRPSSAAPFPATIRNRVLYAVTRPMAGEPNRALASPKRTSTRTPIKVSRS